MVVPAALPRRESKLVRTSDKVAWELSVYGSNIGRVIAEVTGPNSLHVYDNLSLKIEGNKYSQMSPSEVIINVANDLEKVASIYPQFTITPVAFNGCRHELTSQIRKSHIPTSYSL